MRTGSAKKHIRKQLMRHPPLLSILQIIARSSGVKFGGLPVALLVVPYPMVKSKTAENMAGTSLDRRNCVFLSLPSVRLPSFGIVAALQQEPRPVLFADDSAAQALVAVVKDNVLSRGETAVGCIQFHVGLRRCCTADIIVRRRRQSHGTRHQPGTVSYLHGPVSKDSVAASSRGRVTRDPVEVLHGEPRP